MTTTLALDLDHSIDPSTLVLRELTTAEKIRSWRTNSASWAGKLSSSDYLGRETVNGSGELGRDGGIRYWGFVAPEREEKEKQKQGDEQGQQDVIYAAVESLRKSVLVREADGTVGVECAYGIASVFTPVRYRGRKIAGWMMRRLGEWLDGEEADCRFSVLYSDVGEYYSPLGWPSFPSLETSLPASSPTSPKPPDTTHLTTSLLPALCELDIAALTAIICAAPLPAGIHTRLAFLPTYAQAVWHFGAEDFTAEKLYTDPVRAPSVKGAISSSGRTWCYWVHDYSEDKLSILRIVSLDSSSATPKSAGDETEKQEVKVKTLDKEQATQELASVLRAAQAEAADWAFKKVVLWNPDAFTLEACRLVLGDGNEPVVRQRTEGSIPCLRWKGGGDHGRDQQVGAWEKGIDWVALEKYSWC